MRRVWWKLAIRRDGPNGAGGGRGQRPAGVWGHFLRRPQTSLLITFVSLILIGMALLQLPVSQRGERVGSVDALFTATSAVCVTGLITVDTAERYSRFGQTVILVLIQLGALGVMTFGALAAEILRLRVSFSSHAVLRDMFFQKQARGSLRAAAGRIVLMTLCAEAVGAGLLYVGLSGGEAPRGGAFEAVFLSVSAFCNAGFSVYRDNAVGLSNSVVIVWTLMVLIVLGGLGYPVLFEIIGRGWRRLRRREGPLVWSLHARVVLWGSLFLIVAGAVALALTGSGVMGDWAGERALHALFQSVTARTAGFNTIDIGALPLPALLMLIPLMFVGGSPGSCAGGIKTTSAAVWLARVWARLRGRDNIAMFGRRVPHDLVRRAALVIAVAVLWNGLGVLLLALTESSQGSPRFEHIVFEQISAFGTVGLSAGLTPTLTGLGKLWVILSMFVGRVGPLTVALAVLAQRQPVYEYPVERVMIG